MVPHQIAALLWYPLGVKNVIISGDRISRKTSGCRNAAETTESKEENITRAYSRAPVCVWVCVLFIAGKHSHVRAEGSQLLKVISSGQGRSVLHRFTFCFNFILVVNQSSTFWRFQRKTVINWTCYCPAYSCGQSYSSSIQSQVFTMFRTT